MAPTRAEALARLGILDTAALRAEWRRLHSTPAPACLSPDLLRRGLAYRLQECALGGLAPAHRRQLASLASSAGTAPLPDTQPIRLRPGTTLLREWHGSSHAVQVLAQGFEYQGRHYGLADPGRPRHHRRPLVRAALLRPAPQQRGQHQRQR